MFIDCRLIDVFCSSAIVTYLASKFDIADHWYPKDAQKRAKVDEYVSWQQSNLRFFGSMLFRQRVMGGKKEPNPLLVI